MIPFETVRTAMRADDPYEAFDRLVRDEQAHGRKVREIFDDLHPWLTDAHGLPGVSEDAMEAIYGTLDALLGHVHPSCAYRDPDPAALNGHPAADHPAADHPAPARSAE